MPCITSVAPSWMRGSSEQTGTLDSLKDGSMGGAKAVDRSGTPTGRDVVITVFMGGSHIVLYLCLFLNRSTGIREYGSLVLATDQEKYVYLGPLRLHSVSGNNPLPMP